MTQPDQYPFPSDGTPPTQPGYQQSPYQAGPPAGYPGGYPGGYVDPYNPYGVPMRPRNGLGVAGLVLGIVSIVLCFLTILDMLVAVVGIVLSAIALSRARKGIASNKGMALAGLITAVIGGVLAVVILVYAVGKVKPCLDRYPGGGPAYTQCVQNSIIGDN